MKRTILAVVFVMLAAGSASAQSTHCTSMDAGLEPAPLMWQGVSICYATNGKHTVYTKVTLTADESGTEVITKAEYLKLSKQHVDYVREAEQEAEAKRKREEREEDAKMCEQDPNWIADCKSLQTPAGK
jgi:hypothetical protein